MADEMQYTNPMADEDGGGEKKDAGENKNLVPAIIGAVVAVLIIVIAAVAMSGDDPAPAPAPAPPIVVTAPPPAPPPPAPPPVCTPPCANGGSCREGGTCLCPGEIDGTGPLANVWRNGAVWLGDTCEEAPPCSVCGADPYCGLQEGCDPSTPPEPVVAEFAFNADLPAEDIAPGSPARAQFEQAFATDLSNALNIPADNIVVISINGGSTIVKFAILPDANYQTVEGGTGQYAFLPAEKLAELNSQAMSPTLFTRLKTVADVGDVISAPVAIAPDSTVQCGLHLSRMDACNGKMSVEAVCSDRNCIVAMELAAAAATECAAVPGFDNLPDATVLGCTADGGVGPVDSMPSMLVAPSGSCFDTDEVTADAMVSYLPTVYDTFSLVEENLAGVTLDGDVYVVPGFGAHFDGDGDRVSLDVGTSYMTDDSSSTDLGTEGFAIGFWFTREVCHAEQDRWEVLYQHTSNEANPIDLFWDASPARCVAADDSSEADAAACAAVSDPTEGACSAAASGCGFRAARGTTSGLTVAVGCASQFSRSTAGGDIVRIAIKDDNGVNPQFDWQLGCAGSDTGLQGTWIHFVPTPVTTSLERRFESCTILTAYHSVVDPRRF